MASQIEQESGSSSSGTSTQTELTTKLSLVDKIRAIAAKNARSPLDNEEDLTLFLRSWWSKTYNRPLKDPLLEEYTLEDLLYEFYDKIERAEAEEESRNSEDDKILREKEKADEDWAEQEERRELEELKKQKKQAANATAAAEPFVSEEPVADPTKDPDNIKWMEEEMAKAKAQYGPDFGEDVKVNFEE
jgi:hypothetical protein